MYHLRSTYKNRPDFPFKCTLSYLHSQTFTLQYTLYTVEPRYMEDLLTMKITLLFTGSRYTMVKQQKNK